MDFLWQDFFQVSPMDMIHDENTRYEDIAEQVEILKQAFALMGQHKPKEFESASDDELAELYKE